MKNTLLALLTLLSLRCFAQFNDVDIKVGKPNQYESENQTLWNSFLSTTGNLIAIKILSDGFTSTSLNSDGSSSGPPNQYKSIFKDLHFVPYDKNTIQIDGNLYVFGIEETKPDIALIALPIDKFGKPKSDVKRLFSLNAHDTHTEGGSSDFHMRGIEQMGLSSFLSYSADRKKLVVFHRSRDLEKKDGNKYPRILVSVFDKNLSKIASSEFVAPNPEKASRFLSVTSDSKNNIYLYSEVKEDKTKKYELDVIAPNSSEVKKIMLASSDQNEMESISICENKNGEIYAFGYTNTRDAVNAEPLNVRLYKIDIGKGTAKQIVDASLNFAKDNADEYERYNRNKLGGASAIPTRYYKLYPQEIIFREDGSMILINVRSGFNATFIDPTGKLKWTKHIFNFYGTYNYRPFLLGSDGIYLISPTTDGIQKLNQPPLPDDIYLTKISFDGKQTDKLILKGADQVENIAITPDGKTLIADVILGFIKDGKKDSGQIVSQVVTVTLK